MIPVLISMQDIGLQDILVSLFLCRVRGTGIATRKVKNLKGTSRPEMRAFYSRGVRTRDTEYNCA